MKISPALLDTLNKVPRVSIPFTELSTAPLDLILVLMGLRMQQLALTNEKFQAMLAGRTATLRIATEDGIGRSFRLDRGRVCHQAAAGQPDFTIRFQSAEQALNTLLKGDATAFMTGMQAGTIRMEGDFGLLMWFTQAAKLLVPRVPKTVHEAMAQARELAQAKKTWLLEQKSRLIG
jgi:hypothetical protein